jgi:prepilin-type N-terminal cleavage/methylation domain-containing protein
MSTLPVDRRVGRGFTLVEMLVVITIIALLAGLAIPAVIVARTHVRNAAIATDVKQLEMACQAYKEKFGEYPPDFAFVDLSVIPTGTAPPFLTGTQQTNAQSAAQAAVLRHLAKAFSRYTPGVKGGGMGWAGFCNDLAAAGVDYNALTPQTALAFWLGGVPDGITYLPSGFAADPTNPFQTPQQCASRIMPFFDFDVTRLKAVGTATLTAVSGTSNRAWLYWPQGADADHSTGAIAYFRAENGTYTVTDSSSNVYIKGTLDAGDANGGTVYPAFDSRLLVTNADGSHAVTWINPASVQIFAAGLDTRFGAVVPATTSKVTSLYDSALAFPTGENYVAPYTYDDITNFSGGKLESAMP